jgi:glutathione synthase/RimK-type ligase-like ATP-grasp enzyme
MILLPYSVKSVSARLLADLLGCKIALKDGPPLNTQVINWGCGLSPFRFAHCTFLNHPDKVRNAINKIDTFAILSACGVSHVPITQDIDQAKEWQKTNIVLARSVTNGSAGNGIHIVRAGDPMPSAAFYSLYIKKEAEYRVQVLNEKVIDFYQKKKRVGEQSHLIRSHKNGYVACKTGVSLPEQTRHLASSAVKALGLDFGGVDIVQGKNGKFYVLEVNTAPGLTKNSAEVYANAIKAHLS